MIIPDFNKFKNMTLSDTKKASDSEIGWREFLVAVSFFTNHCSFKITEDQIIDITKSLQNWTFRRNFTDFFEKDANNKPILATVDIGEIFLADLGLSYETAYVHPVVVLEKIGNKLLVVPTTTASEKVNTAFHPITNKTGNKFYRKVLEQDGFDEDCALMLNSILVISKGRLLERKGKLTENISDNTSIFNEIKKTIFEKYLGKLFREYEEVLEENIALREELEILKKQNQSAK